MPYNFYIHGVTIGNTYLKTLNSQHPELNSLPFFLAGCIKKAKTLARQFCIDTRVMHSLLFLGFGLVCIYSFFLSSLLFFVDFNGIFFLRL